MVKLTLKLLDELRDKQIKIEQLKRLKNKHSVEPCNTIKQPIKKNQPKLIIDRNPINDQKVMTYNQFKAKYGYLKSKEDSKNEMH